MDEGTALAHGKGLPVEADPFIGRVFGLRFTITARLGAGSMGTVYRAVQAPMGRPVAIKILRSDRAVDEMSRARFLREARANSSLVSPNTVTVFDFGQSNEGDFYLAMELLEGESLGDRLRRLGRIEPADAVSVARQALRSLSEAHAKGIIHRDLKPDNLFFARVRTGDSFEEVVKVLDFGVAKMLNGQEDASMNPVETQAGTVFGTPRYMSPEQAQGKPLDARSDLYSLGVLLYHMLAGRPPFGDDDAIVVMARHIKTMPAPLSQIAPGAAIGLALEEFVMRALSKDPAERPQSADEMFEQLTWIQESTQTVAIGPTPARRRSSSGSWRASVTPLRAAAVVSAILAVSFVVATIVTTPGPRSRPAEPRQAATPPSAVARVTAAAVPVASDPHSQPLPLATAASGSSATSAAAIASVPRRVEVHPPRPPPPPRAASQPTPVTKPETKPAVGYGYLE